MPKNLADLVLLHPDSFARRDECLVGQAVSPVIATILSVRLQYRAALVSKRFLVAAMVILWGRMESCGRLAIRLAIGLFHCGAFSAPPSKAPQN
jgi:hypothetical protein